MDVHVQAALEPTDPGHNPPKSSAIPVPFSYTPSEDGANENLLILLHGLGDTHLPFAKLGEQLRLPQTATLAIRAPKQIPYLHEEAYQWYEAFDLLGETLANPNPTSALDLLSNIFDHLTTHCQWPPHKIHLFGFGQGGSLAVEFCLKRWKQLLAKHPNSLSPPLGSVITISGPLLSYPTVTNLCPTPVFVFHRPAPAESADAMTSFGKGFNHVREARVGGERMPKSRHEWEPIMEFWSRNLSIKQMGGLYEVISGAVN